MQTMQCNANQPEIGSIQLRLRPLLCPACQHGQAAQGQGSGDVGRNCEVQEKPRQIRDSWFAERRFLGVALSPSELQHGVNAGIISSSLLM